MKMQKLNIKDSENEVEENNKTEIPEIEGHFLVGLQTNSPDTSKSFSVSTLDKTSWTDDEKEIIMRYFHSNIEMKQVPGKDECENCLQKELALCKRTWKDVKFCVYNLIKQNREVAVSVCVEKERVAQSPSYSDGLTHSPATSKLNKPSVVSPPKTIWTDEEIEAIKRHFQWNIEMKKVPGKFECENCLKNESVLSNKAWKTVKFCVFNLIKKK